PRLALAMAVAVSIGAPFTLIPASDRPSKASQRPRYVMLEPAKWIGRSIHESTLSRWLDTRGLPGDATWVLFRVDCEHCRDYLRRLAAYYPSEPKVYVLVELAER